MIGQSEGTRSVFSKLKEETAQGLTEYALLGVAVALALIVMVTLFGERLSGFYSSIITHLPF